LNKLKGEVREKEVLVVVDKKEKFACITPNLEILSTVKSFFEFLNSHKWRVLKSESYGEDGFLSKLSCSNCNLDYDLALTNILESARTARRIEIMRTIGNSTTTTGTKQVGSLESDAALWGLYLDRSNNVEEKETLTNPPSLSQNSSPM
jgi:hypothetical protein